MTVLVWAGVAVLGGIGALARFALDGAAVGGDALLLAGTATLGSYTTFSTWMLESQRLGEDGQGGRLALNVALPLAAGLAAAALGHAIGSRL